MVLEQAWTRLSRIQTEYIIVVSLATILTASLVAGSLVTLACPEAARSGVPRLKIAF